MESRSLKGDVTWVAWIVAWCAALGLIGGQIWMWKWSPPTGQIVQHHWYPDPWDAGNRSVFAATGWYCVVALCGGVLTGVMACWLTSLKQGREVLTVVAVAIGAVVGALIMRQVGVLASPPSPSLRAATSPDGTMMLGALAAPGVAAVACFPTAALLVLTGWMFLRASAKPVGSESVLT